MNTKKVIRFDNKYLTMNWDILLYIKKKLEILNIKYIIGIIPHNKNIDIGSKIPLYLTKLFIDK